jgi:hypothetical protein
VVSIIILPNKCWTMHLYIYIYTNTYIFTNNSLNGHSPSWETQPLKKFHASRRGLLRRDAVQCCGRIPMFPKSMLPLTYPEDGGSMDLWNVGILPQHYTASQRRRPRLETSPWKPQNSYPYFTFNCFRIAVAFWLGCEKLSSASLRIYEGKSKSKGTFQK